MPPRRASAGERARYGSPRTVIEPLSGWTAPVRILTSVLLPAPLAPISAWTSPALTDRDADRRAATAPYRFAISVAWSNTSGIKRSLVGLSLGCGMPAEPASQELSEDPGYSPGPLQAMRSSTLYVVQSLIVSPRGHSLLSFGFWAAVRAA